MSGQSFERFVARVRAAGRRAARRLARRHGSQRRASRRGRCGRGRGRRRAARAARGQADARRARSPRPTRRCDGEGGAAAVALAGVALELLQAYLLVHDDWMDGDDVRRGGPSVPGVDARALRAEHAPTP